MKAPVVTILHGTFEPDAGWTKVGSPFWRAMEERVGAVAIEPCVWTGKNTFEARREGVATLEAHVVAIEKMFSGSPHFLVGHSHGGSIIAYWLKHTARNHERIAGAAFLSTPFVAVRPVKKTASPASLADQALPVLMWLGGIGAVAMVVLLCWIIGWLVAGFSESRTAQLLIAGALLCGPLAGVIWYWRNRKTIRQFASGEGIALLTKVADAHSTCDLRGQRYLFLKTTADEVLSGLGTAQFVGLVVGKIVEVAARSKARVERWISRLAGFIALMSLVAFVTWVIQWVRWNESQSLYEFATAVSTLWWIQAFNIFVALLIGVILTASATFVCGMIAMRLPLMAFGDIDAVAAAFLEISVEPLPYGTWKLHHVQWAPSQEGLHHSAGYAAPEAIDLVVDWMDESLRLDADASAKPLVPAPTVAPIDGQWQG